MCVFYKQSVFIHIPKTAGTSITAALLCIPRALRLCVPGKEIVNPHIPAKSMQYALGQQAFSSLWSYAIVRNPWDRVVSYYHFIHKHPLHPEHEDVIQLDFEEYVSYFVENISPQFTYISDNDNNIIVKYVGTFEEVNEAWTIIKYKLNINQPKKLSVINTTTHDHYSTYYNNKTIDIIDEFESDLIECCGYTFEHESNSIDSL